MSYKQSRAGISNSLQYREKGRSGSTQAVDVEPYPAPQASPTKAPGDASKSFPLQFGSVSSDTLNEMQKPEEGAKHINAGLGSISIASGQEKPVPILGDSKSFRGKKKLKSILQKANAVGKSTIIQKTEGAKRVNTSLVSVSAASGKKKPVLKYRVVTPISVIPSPDPTLRNEEEVAKHINPGLVSLSAASCHKKPVPELTSFKSSRGKNKLKTILQKTDAGLVSLSAPSSKEKPVPRYRVVNPISVNESPDITLRDEEGSKHINFGLVSLSTATGKEKLVPEHSSSKKSKGKKKVGTILQKTDVAGKTSDLHHVYKGWEEKSETVAASESNYLEDVWAASVHDNVENNLETTSESAPSTRPQDSFDNFRKDNSLVSSASIVPDAHEPTSTVESLASSDGDHDVLFPDLNLKNEGGAKNADLVSLSAASGDEKPVPNLSKRGKKKLNRILKKADAAGIASDLNNAYKGPEEKKETVAASERNKLVHVSVDSIQSDVYSSEKEAVGKVEPNDREDAVDIVSGGIINLGGEKIELIMKRYSREFLLHLSAQCTDLAEDFDITSHVANGLMVPNAHASCESYPNPGRVVDRSPRGRRNKIPGSLVIGHDHLTPIPVMHKAEKKYELGKIIDEEEAKQRQLKAIMNKLTPQNVKELLEQFKAINIDNAGTLAGVISLIFGNALMEPTFCEMYANLCYHLAGELPDFIEGNEKITFKRLLINKLQEEFERVEREQEEAGTADVKGEVEKSLLEEKRIQTQRRLFGNIRLIGELYKKKMLTERIMHECIKKLLGQYENPIEENIKALCILLSTIGEMIDHPEAKDHMDSYFDMMSRLSNNVKLSSWVRFKLKDAIDLRKNQCQQKRKGDAVLEHISSKKSKGKKKLRTILQKTDIAGKTFDLHHVKKGPEEKSETVAASESHDLEDIWAASVHDNAENNLKTSESALSTHPQDSFDNFKKDSSLVSTASIALDAYESTSTVNKLASSDGDRNILFPEASTCRSESLDEKPDFAKPIVVDDVAAPVSVILSWGLNLKNGEEGVKNADLVSLSVASGKEKPVPKLSRRGKLKLKRLQKEAAAGITSDLDNAYKCPEEKKETILASESNNLVNVSVESVQNDVYSNEKEVVGKAEPNDLEDSDTFNTVSEGINNLGGEKIELIIKKYNRDFLLKLSAQCTDLAEGFEVTSHVAALIVTNGDAYPNPGVAVDRSPGQRRNKITGKVDVEGCN